jgi:cytochrome c peroxidase
MGVKGSSVALTVALLFALGARGDLLEQQRRLQILSLKIPEGLNLSRSVKGNTFQLSYVVEPERPKVPLGEMHDWKLALIDFGGHPVRGARIRVEGTMPQHSHPLPTYPDVKELAHGFYRVSGLKFHMPGWWVVTFLIDAHGKKDEISFNLLLGDRADTGTASENFWTAAEKGLLRDLWIGSLRELGPADFPDNPVAFNPEARELGRLLFHDPTLSKDGKNSCSSCHLPEKGMSGGRVVQVAGQGPRKAPSILGAAWQSWFFWDGRKDSLWSQALGPILSPGEIGMTKAAWRKAVAAKYGRYYRAVFGDRGGKSSSGDDEFLVNTARAIAAYEITLRPGPSAFDRYVERTLGLTPVPAAAGVGEPAPFGDCALVGLRAFIGKGRCVNCHHGPRFENGSFHATGILPVSTADSPAGRIQGIDLARKDPFNCHGRYGRKGAACAELDHAIAGSPLIGAAFKTPTLRNVEVSAPYMHNGRLASLDDVVGHYAEAYAPPGGSELVPLALSGDDRRGLVCFLKSLTSESQSVSELRSRAYTDGK